MGGKETNGKVRWLVTEAVMQSGSPASQNISASQIAISHEKWWGEETSPEEQRSLSNKKDEREDGLINSDS